MATPSDRRVAVTLGSELHRDVLEMWAQAESRSPANLCSYLLEDAFRRAAKNGDMPDVCLEALQSAK